MLAGNNLIAAYETDSANAFRYDDEYGLNEEEVLYPCTSSNMYMYFLGEAMNFCRDPRKRNAYNHMVIISRLFCQ